MVYGGPQMTYASDEAEIRYGVRAVDPGAYTFRGLDGFGELPDLPIAKEATDLTPVEFLDRVQRVGWGVAYLARSLPRHLRLFQEFEADQGEGYAFVVLKLNVAIVLIDTLVARTSEIFGTDWTAVLAAAPPAPLQSPRGSALAHRMSTAGAAAVKEWLGAAQELLQSGFDAIQAEIDVRYAEAESDLAFWGALYAMTVGLAKLPIEGLGALIAGLLDLLGEAGGAAAGSLAKALWKIVKPLLIPAALLGGGYVAYRVYQRRRRAALRPLPPHAHLPSGGR